jgi:Family of unknown function (DUF5675)
MELTLNRFAFYENSTIGRLNINGFFYCFTLEDAFRPDGLKIKGSTAIPAGRYQVVVNKSPRFQKELPLLLGVPNFIGVRIHSGNTPADTSGCILVGNNYRKDYIGESKNTEIDLVKKLKLLSMNESIWINVTNFSQSA